MKPINETAHFLVTPGRLLRLYTDPGAVKRFSRPVQVEPLWSTLERLLMVREVSTGSVYPVDAANIRRGWQLTNRQRVQALE